MKNDAIVTAERRLAVVLDRGAEAKLRGCYTQYQRIKAHARTRCGEVGIQVMIDRIIGAKVQMPVAVRELANILLADEIILHAR